MVLTLKRYFIGLVAGVGLFMALAAGAVWAQAVTKGYQTDQSLQKGMLVRLHPKDPNKVEALAPENSADMLGVVVAAGDAPISLSNNEGDADVFVANSGQYGVLVSTQNGPITVGDMISISSIKGIGMKADDGREVVIGKAKQSFTDRSIAESKSTLTDSNGQKIEVAIGRILVDVAVAHNPNYRGESIPGVPTFISKVAQAVTDEPVQAIRIYAGLAVLVIAVIIAGWILYAGVRTGMVAVGRNPLAKKAVTRNLVRVILIALIIVVIGVVAVYLLLRI